MSSQPPRLADWLHALLTNEFEVPADAISADARLREDLGLESLDLVDIVLEVEQRVGRRLDEKDVAEISTVGDVSRLLDRITAEAAAATPAETPDNE